MSLVPKTIMIVEDESALAEVLQDYLTRDGFSVCHLAEGTHVVETVRSNPPDLIILDLMLPGKDGLQICREIRQDSDVPIILATARVEEIDRLLGLELGADDYVCKPYSPREIVARVKAILRRVAAAQAPTRSPALINLQAETLSASISGNRLDLTVREFQLLSVLAKRPGRVFSRAQLLDLAYPDDADIYDRTIDSHIKNIRKKIAEYLPDVEVIRSVYGIGYAYEG